MGKLKDSIISGGYIDAVTIPKSEFTFDLPRGNGIGKLDMTWFSPALLYIHSPFNDNVLSGYMDAHGDPTLGYCRFRRPIFAGMTCGGDAAWNHVLWGVRTEAWSSFSNHILGTTYLVGTEKLVRYGMNRIRIADPLMADRGELVTEDSQLDVYVFGVDATNGRAYIPEAAIVTADLPTVRILSASEVMAECLAAITSGKNVLVADDDSLDTDSVSHD